MKNLFLFILLSLPIPVVALTLNPTQIKSSQIENIPEINLPAVQGQTPDSVEANVDNHGRFRIYSTTNFYNFIKLDSSTGVISQYQWSLDDNEGFVGFINRENLSEGNPFPGRFSLHPTKNQWTFILLDNYDGRLWHVQWGRSDSNRKIRRIYF